MILRYNLYILLFLELLFLTSCNSMLNKIDDAGYLKKNKFGKISLKYNIYEEPDSLLYEVSGTKEHYSIKLNKNQKYPFLYENLVGYMYADSIQFLDLIASKEFFIHTTETFLTTASATECGNKLIVRDYKRLNIVDMKKRKVIVSFRADDTTLNNATVDDSNFYIAVSVTEQDGFHYHVLKGKMNGGKVIILSKDIMDMPISGIEGDRHVHWSGMRIYDDIIFLTCQNNLLAIDKNNGSILDKCESQEWLVCEGKVQPNIIFTKENKTIKFNLNSKKFN